MLRRIVLSVGHVRRSVETDRPRQLILVLVGREKMGYASVSGVGEWIIK